MTIEREHGSRRMLMGLLAASHLMPMERVPEQARVHGAYAGFTDVCVYVADVQGSVLRLLTGMGLDVPAPGDCVAEPELPIEGTLAGRAYQYGEIVPVTVRDDLQWWVPMLDGAERLGLVRLTTPHDDDQARQDAESLASLLALLVVTKRDHSDSYARLVRTTPMNVAAEMQWHLMPPRTYADGRVVISAVMEPAYRISGDAFDYALAGPVVHLSIFDAMGHDTAAGLAANLAVGACRNSRRQGSDLVDTSERVEELLLEQFRHDSYVTGILADLDTSTGELTWVNRGHHPPLVIRGGRWTSRLTCPPAHPMGTDLKLPVTVCREQLEPGDRLVLYTDGITEARRPGSNEFGLERFSDFLIRRHADGLPVPETLRRLIQAVMEHHEGHLDDDATILLCEWLGPRPERTREAAAHTGTADP